jgi:phenylalanyl-tRNA synthetase beta chain
LREQLPVIVEISHDVLVRKIGNEVTEAQVVDILNRLGFVVVSSKGLYTITVPSWRATGDVSIAPDIIEEVARHV